MHRQCTSGCATAFAKHFEPYHIMKYTVTVTESVTSSGMLAGSASANVSSTVEIFRQGFDELDLSKFVVALNARPRGRPTKSAKKEAA